MQVDDEAWRRATDAICRSFVAAASVDGAAFVEIYSAQDAETWCWSDEVVAHLHRIQYTLGEGPTWDAFESRRPVLVPDLAAAGALARWPMFVGQLGELPARGLFAIPMQVGAITAGVCLSYRRAPGPLSPPDLQVLLRAVDAATLALLTLRARTTTQQDLDEIDAIGAGEGALPRTVHQATGMLVVQLGVNLEDAFARLRAHAYATNRSLHSVAEDIVERRLRLEVDPPDAAAPKTDP